MFFRVLVVLCLTRNEAVSPFGKLKSEFKLVRFSAQDKMSLAIFCFSITNCIKMIYELFKFISLNTCGNELSLS